MYWYNHELEKYWALQRQWEIIQLSDIVKYALLGSIHLLKGPLKVSPFVPVLKWQFRQGKWVEHGDVRMLKNTNCLSIHLFTHKTPSAMVCLSSLLPDLYFPVGEDVLQPSVISSRPYHLPRHTLCLSCQLTHLRISTPERRLHASDFTLIFILDICFECKILWHSLYTKSWCVISCHAIVR